MSLDDLIPPMFATEPAFESIIHIGKIRILHREGEIIGEFIPYHRPKDKLFGARIDILGPPVPYSGPQPIPEGRFITAGHFTVAVYKLSLESLRKIEQTGDANIPYIIRL